MYKLYATICFAISLPVIVLVNVITWSGQQDYSSDLTRVGGFAEQDYGWNGVHDSFDQQEEMVIVNTGDYHSYTDIVVLGDSFSHRQGSNWLLHFINLSGFSGQVMHHQHGGIERITNAPLFKEQPPKVVIYQLIERSLHDQFHIFPTQCESQPHPAVPLPTLPEQNTSGKYTSTAIKRDTSLHYGNYQMALKQLKNRFYRAIGRSDKLKAREARLSRDDFFSSRKRDHLLFYRRDAEKASWPEALPNQLICGLQLYRQLIESNGKTAFIVILVPDKLSAYSPWIDEPSTHLAQLSVLDNQSINAIPGSFPLHDRVITAIDQGFVDFYLPSDTHWSSQGDLLVATWLLEIFPSPDTPGQP